MPGAFRFFAGGFGGRDEPTADALSMVNFEPGYIGQLIEFGEQDTHERMDEIEVAAWSGRLANLAGPFMQFA